MPITQELNGQLLKITATGVISVEELQEAFDALEEIVRTTEGPIVSVLDALECDVMKMKDTHRDMAIDAMKKMRGPLADRHKAHAIVLGSMVTRTLSNVAYKFIKPADRSKAFGDVAKAEAWVRKSL